MIARTLIAIDKHYNVKASGLRITGIPKERV